jgi:hypothetical protein
MKLYTSIFEGSKVSWQIVPIALGELLGGPDPAGAARAMKAMLEMDKLDIAALRRAYGGR